LWGQSDVADLIQGAETIRGLKKEVQDLKVRLQFSEENQRALQMENEYLKNLQASATEEMHLALYGQHQMSMAIPVKDIQHIAAHPGSFIPVYQQPSSGDNRAAWLNTLTIRQDLMPEQSGNPASHGQQIGADILDAIGYDLHV
jgi:hypothetical protein